MKRKFILMLIIVIMLICVGCSSSKEMTELDVEFNDYAVHSAERLLNDAIEGRKNIIVESGQLEYYHTLYNEEHDLYKVRYVANYDTKKGAKTKNEWIVIDILLSGDEKFVLDTDFIWRTGTCEEMRCDATKNADGFWYNINLTDKEIEEYYDDLSEF